jgi:DnaK suppressor protein
MKPQKLDYFKQILINQLKDLLNEAQKTVTNLIQEGKGNVPDLTDLASLETDRTFLLRIKDRERKLISKIQETLKKVENGTYGICERCGKEIDEERLKARPVASYCAECKKTLEAMEKLGKY